MPSTYTSSLRLTLPATGELSGSWGNTVNTGITELTDAAIAGYVSIAMTDADYTLTSANGATDEARRMMLNMTGTLTGARNVICPTASKIYIIKNATTGGFAITLKTSGGTGISIPNGKSMLLMCDGTNVVDAVTQFSSGAFTNLAYTGTLTGGTGVVNLGSGQFYKDASGNVGIGTSSPGVKLDVRGNATFTGNATARQTADFTNTGGQLYVGAESSAGGAVFTGSSAYSGVIGTNTNTVLQFATNGTVRATLDTSGNLGLGVTPSAWTSTYKAFALGSVNSNLSGFWDGTTAITTLATGGAVIGGAWTYTMSGQAVSRYAQLGSGAHAWYTAPSGTAGNAISFTQAMTLDASGNLVVGNTAANERLEIYKGVAYNSDPALYFRIGSIDTSVNNNTPYTWRTGITGSATGYNYVFQTLARTESSWVERARITSGGNFGIGTTSPSNKLVVSNAGAEGAETRTTHGDGTTAGASFLSYNRSGAAFTPLEVSGSILKFSISDTERARVTSGGDLLVGTTTNAGSFKFLVQTASSQTGAFVSTGTNAFVNFSDSTSTNSPQVGSAGDNLLFRTQATERARIDSSGNLLVGTTTNNGRFSVDGTSTSTNQAIWGKNLDATGTAATYVAWNAATTGSPLFIDFYTETSATRRGTISYNRGAGQVAYNVTSDVRLKENIADAADAGGKVDALQVRQFDWKETGNHIDYGFVAQELEPIVPHAVSKPDAEDEMWSVDYSKLVPMLAKEIQSLRARVASLENQP